VSKELIGLFEVDALELDKEVFFGLSIN